MINTIFKLGLLAIGIVFLVLFFQYSTNGRYEFNIDSDDGVLTIFDTRHGTYHLGSFPIQKDEPETWQTMAKVKKNHAGNQLRKISYERRTR